MAYGVNYLNFFYEDTCIEFLQIDLVDEEGTMAEIAIVSFYKNTGEMVDYVRFNRNQSTKVAGQ